MPLSHHRANRPTLWQVAKQASMPKTQFDAMTRKQIIASIYQATMHGELKNGYSFEFKDGKTGAGEYQEGKPKDLFKLKKKKTLTVDTPTTIHISTRVAKRRN